MEFHERLKELLDARRLTGPAFAKRLPRTSESQVLSILRGATKDPRTTTLREIAEGLGITIDELLKGVEFRNEENKLDLALAPSV